MLFFCHVLLGFILSSPVPPSSDQEDNLFGIELFNFTPEIPQAQVLLRERNKLLLQRQALLNSEFETELVNLYSEISSFESLATSRNLSRAQFFEVCERLEQDLRARYKQKRESLLSESEEGWVQVSDTTGFEEIPSATLILSKLFDSRNSDVEDSTLELVETDMSSSRQRLVMTTLDRWKDHPIHDLRDRVNADLRLNSTSLGNNFGNYTTTILPALFFVNGALKVMRDLTGEWNENEWLMCLVNRRSGQKSSVVVKFTHHNFTRMKGEK